MPKVKSESKTQTQSSPESKKRSPTNSSAGKKPPAGYNQPNLPGVEASTTARSTSAKTLPKEPEQRETLYPEPKARLGMLTADLAKKYLGWVTPVGEQKFGADRHFIHDLCGPVKFTNNVTNRPIYTAVVETLVQEILRGNWELNGEPVIIGKTGLVLNGQHTLIAIVLAAQKWSQAKQSYSDAWPEEPKVSKFVIVGIDESDKVVNTMDTCKPRTLADVFYRSEHFRDMPSNSRKKASRVCDYAVRLLWHRTGAGLDAFTPRRTHAESLDFINRHPTVLRCVKHIIEEDGKDGRIQRYMPPGYAAGMLYLMAASGSNESLYSESHLPVEADTVDLKLFDEACNFFVELAAGATGMVPVVEAFIKLADTGGTLEERCAVLSKAWLAYPKVKPDDLKLEYEIRDGVRYLVEQPTVGGIDLGPQRGE